eukprot:CAMPEP_0180666922 /NCGR_PEP_ID=MMETSP1037_2-20121125/62068_1 /TAXON_ID=632150 /ORGANISM="Azadinium spinosum, Strain 3D9" /LENGTH=110 /DNA_ID=CAMNT_0022695453 /DNA_START=257 /DNA_END=586 /DNA_ORIENTATION=+
MRTLSLLRRHLLQVTAPTHAEAISETAAPPSACPLEPQRSAVAGHARPPAAPVRLFHTAHATRPRPSPLEPGRVPRWSAASSRAPASSAPPGCAAQLPAPVSGGCLDCAP